MNPNAIQALDFLSRQCIRQHHIGYAATVADGAPGGLQTVSHACQCIVHDGFNIIREDDTLPCTCGAREHNQKVGEAYLLISAELLHTCPT